MPPRWMTGLIIAGWVCVTGWLCYREFRPYFATDQPPRYVPDLADEAITTPVPVRWSLMRDGQTIGSASSRLAYEPATDTFAMETTLRDLDLEFPLPVGGLSARVPSMETVYRIDREGELVGFRSGGQLAFRIRLLGFDQTFRFDTDMSGRVVGDKLLCRARLGTDFGNWEDDIDPITLRGGGVLNPLQPLPRITDLRPGQSWRQPIFNPIDEVMRKALPRILADLDFPSEIGLPGGGGPRELLAVVDSQPRELIHPRTNQVDQCWVIRYTEGNAEVGSTWVEVSTGKVLRQVASSMGETLELLRE